MATTDTDDPRRWPRLLGAGSTAVAAVAMVVGVGPLGVLAGVVLFAAWILAPAVYAFAVGHLLVLAVDLSMLALVAVEGGLIGLLAASLPRFDARAIGAFIMAFIALFGVLRGAQGAVDALWLVALALVGSVALPAYGLHRYELVRFGLVEAPS